MRNQAVNPFRDELAGDAPRAELALRPGLRLGVLFVGVLLPMLVIGGRFAYVQTQLGTDYAAEYERTIEKREPIAARDGRILAEGGEVLAEDIELFGLKVHYRWLEDPADPAWVKQQALSRLDRAARKKPDLVAAEIERVMETRARLWERLQKLSGLDGKQLATRRREVQKRVEHIYELVERRRETKEEEGEALEPVSDFQPNERQADWKSALQTGWNTVIAALTTPPQREEREPLVIREQMDYHLLFSEVPVETAVEVEAHPERYPGVRVEMTTRRVYPHGALAPHLIGYRTAINADELLERREKFQGKDPLNYQAGDRIGRTGLELQYERQLRGLRGERKLVLNRRGEVIRTETIREPRDGRDIVIALNVPLQKSAEALLDDVLQHHHEDETNGKPLPLPPGGVIVALDVRTGAVLAAASGPRFDLRLFTDPDEAQWRRTVADDRKPLFHRATEMTLAPGSTFKVLSAIAFLESGKLDPERHFDCQGFLDNPDSYRCFTFRNFGVGHGPVNLVDALARSCNVYFFSAARRIGPEPLHEWGTRFGFGQPTGIDLPSERSGNLPPLIRGSQAATRGSKRSRIDGDTLQLAIGQAKLTTTPLQVARMMAAVANGGTLITPHLAEADGVTGLAGSVPAESGAAALHLTEAKPIPELSPRTLEWVRMGLRNVVAHPQGTAYKTVRLKEIAVAGKTGTAEPGGGKPDHAWFAGYVPADQPRVAFVVVLEHAGSGGHAAGPVARKFVQALGEQGALGEARVPAASAN